MPYQGDTHTHPEAGRFTTDFAYLRNLPGAFVMVQLICCVLAFMLAVSGTAWWGVRTAHGFFTITVFLCMLSCACWLIVRVFQLDGLFKRTINWNKAGLVYNGVNALLLVVASCVLLDIASEARPLRAAAVFGFLGFTAFLSGLVWEIVKWRTDADSDFVAFSTAKVIRGPDRSRTPDSMVSTGVAVPEERGEEGVSFVGIKPRPVSFMDQQVSGNTRQVSTPMLMVPPSDDSDDFSNHSDASSIQGEWQTAASSVPA